MGFEELAEPCAVVGGETTTSSIPYWRPPLWTVLRLLRSRLSLMFVSSNGRHLKSFLYPPHSTFLLLHCSQPGFSSPHFRRFALQVTQPVHKHTVSAKAVSHHASHCNSGHGVSVPFRLLDCFGLSAFAAPPVPSPFAAGAFFFSSGRGCPTFSEDVGGEGGAFLEMNEGEGNSTSAAIRVMPRLSWRPFPCSGIGCVTETVMAPSSSEAGGVLVCRAVYRVCCGIRISYTTRDI